LLPDSFQLIVRLSCVSCNGMHPVLRTNDQEKLCMRNMAQDRDRWRALVSAVMNLRVP
jgi:hypothetical protein